MFHLHLFLSSPGDVSYERLLAREVTERLDGERTYRNRLKLEVVAWDKPGAGAAMSAQFEPQDAIERGLKNPSQCDIVIVIFWARMGTPLSTRYLKDDGTRYRSGTEYEFLNAIDAAKKMGKPDVLVYRRKGAPKINVNDPKRKDIVEQWELVEEFFGEFRNPDGSFRSFYKEYDTPSDFKDLLDQDLRDLFARYLEAHPAEAAVSSDASIIPKLEIPRWEGSPFPGLRAFTTEEALIFFGRGRETDELILKLSDTHTRFIAVVGASGSGKSSLVKAGVLPALQKNAIPGSRDWLWVRFSPAEIGENPFMALASAFKTILEKHGRKAWDMAEEIETTPDKLSAFASIALEGKPDWTELLFFIDSFEELFTLVDSKYQRPFIDLLVVLAQTARLRAVIALRADFYDRCLEWPELGELLAKGHYTQLAPRIGALYEMITRPSDRAGLMLEDGLADRILDDMGLEPGALALMAFTLSELWKRRIDGRLTHKAYDDFGGVRGAIGKVAEDSFRLLECKQSAKEATLAQVFRELIEVDERGVATRRRASLTQVAGSAEAAKLVRDLASARLLVTSRGEGQDSVVEVAHEAILTSWPRLSEWIESTRGDLRLLRLVRSAAHEWEVSGRKKHFLWPHERLLAVWQMLEGLRPNLNRVEQDFVRPESEWLLEEIDNPATMHQDRARIGDRLAKIGDIRPGVGLRQNGLPDFIWCPVPTGEITIDTEQVPDMERSPRLERRGLGGFFRKLLYSSTQEALGIETLKQERSRTETFSLKSFYISRYPVTWIQYRCFLEADDGYRNKRWWEGLAMCHDDPGQQYRQLDNHPAENVSWYDAVAFCRWLTNRQGYEIRLSTEWEWQLTATGGDPSKVYPWGPEWDSNRANTGESGLSRSTAVGLYPCGASPVGALDMSGNVWEWCLNAYETPRNVNLAGDVNRAVRGGSWRYDQDLARAAFRSLPFSPGLRDHYVGFRVVRTSHVLG